MNCLHCNAETSNGLALCALCSEKARIDLEYTGVYFRNLSRWRRPARPNGSLGGSGSWLLRSGEGDANRIGRALDEAGAMLAGWAQALADDRGIETPEADDEATQATAMCVWLTEHLTSVATLEWCGEFVRDLGVHETRLRELTETAVPGWYAGACKRCALPTYVVPRLTWVTCKGCGATTYARDHLETILKEARGWVAAPKRIAETLVALLDTEMSVERLYERIRKIAARDERRKEAGQPERLTTLRRLDEDGDETGPKRFRFGEVFDIVVADGPTRVERTERATA